MFWKMYGFEFRVYVFHVTLHRPFYDRLIVRYYRDAIYIYMYQNILIFVNKIALVAPNINALSRILFSSLVVLTVQATIFQY